MTIQTAVVGDPLVDGFIDIDNLMFNVLLALRRLRTTNGVTVFKTNSGIFGCGKAVPQQTNIN